MNIDQDSRTSENSSADVLAELTGQPVDEFEYDGEIPELDELKFRLISSTAT